MTMPKEITNTERIANELLLEKYEPILFITFSVEATRQLDGNLAETAEKIRVNTGYRVIIIPNEKETTAKILSVCKTEIVEIEKLMEYIYGKFEDSVDLQTTPFSKLKDRLKNIGK